MIKKGLIILLMFVLLFPVEALANDGGAISDGNKYLSVNVKLHSKEAEVNEDFSLSINLKNKSKDIINISSIGQIFSNNYISWDSKIQSDFSSILLNPGEKTTIDLTTTVPISVMCYIKNHNYYTDFDFDFIYYIDPVDKDDYSKRHSEVYEHKYKKIPIKITNMYDGLSNLNLVLQEKETICYFPDYQNHNYNIYDEYLRSTVTDTLKVTNTSDKLITDLYIEDLKSRISWDDKSVLTLASKKDVEVEITYHNFIHQKKLPKTLTAKYMINYKIGNQYYTAHIKKTYPAKILNCPILDVTQNNDYVTILNTSYTDLTELYVDVNCDEYHYMIYNEDNLIPILHNNSSIEIPCSTSKIEKYVVGLIRERKIYLWNIDNINKTPYYNFEDSHRYFHIKEILPTSTPTPSPTNAPTPSPTLAPIQTQTPTPTKEVTPEPTLVIEVTNVATESSMPLWVWVVLVFAVVGAGTVIYVFRNKNNDEDSK